MYCGRQNQLPFDGDGSQLPGPVVDVTEDPAMDGAQVPQVVAGRDRGLPEEDQRGVGDLPLGGLQIFGRAQPELVAQHSRHRVGVRVPGHLRPPVAGNGPAVQLSGAYVPVYVRRHLAIVLRTERSRQLHLYRLRGGKSTVQAGALAGKCLVPLVGLVGYEDRLGLAVRPEGDGFGRGALTPEPGKDAR
jgi:hypothetical protein